MAIYDITDVEKKEERKEEVLVSELSQEKVPFEGQLQASLTKDRLFSSICARLFFLLLLTVDILWACFSVIKLTLLLVLSLCLFFKKDLWEHTVSKTWIALKRSLVCGLSLFVALFSPGFGVMIACTYFLMYDKDGIEEVVPASLQDQFKDFFKGTPS